MHGLLESVHRFGCLNLAFSVTQLVRGFFVVVRGFLSLLRLDFLFRCTSDFCVFLAVLLFFVAFSFVSCDVIFVYWYFDIDIHTAFLLRFFFWFVAVTSVV